MTGAQKGTGKHLNLDINEDEHDSTLVNEDQPVALTGKLDADVVDEDINPLDKLPDIAVRNANGTVTLPLLYPVTIRSQKDGKIREKEYAELTFHRLTGKDQRAIATASDETQGMVSFSQSTKINQAVMNALWDKMDLGDIANGGKVLNHFLNSGQKTGR